MSQAIHSLLSKKLEGLAETGPQDANAIAAIKEFLEMERQAKLQLTAGAEDNQIVPLHQKKAHLNLVS